jgi:ATP-dependent Lon protease
MTGGVFTKQTSSDSPRRNSTRRGFAVPILLSPARFEKANCSSHILQAASEFIGDRNLREHECSIQLRAFDTSKHGRSLGVTALLALCSALINKSLRGGLVIVGSLNLGGSIDPLLNAIDMVELAVEKGASVILMPVSSRKQPFDLSDDLATRITAVFYSDAREAFSKAVADS